MYIVIDILGIEPVKVSTDLASYSTFIYGPAKIGKSTLVHELYGDRVLHVMTEKRYKTLSGAHVAYVSKWSEFLEVMGQLRKPQVKERYDVISIDTVDNLADYAEKYIASKWEEESIGERTDTWGGDWRELKQTWKDGLSMIEKNGFTAVFVSHSIQETTKIPVEDITEGDVNSLSDYSKVTEKGVNYLEFLRYKPDLSDRYMNPINKMVDNILFLTNASDSSGNEKRVIRTRESLQWIAGSTFEGIQPVIDLNAKDYEDAVSEAIQGYGKENLTEERQANFDVKTEELDFDALMEEAKDFATKFYNVDKLDLLNAEVESIFGVGNKLTEATPKQVELLAVAVDRFKEIADKEGIA